AVLSWTHRWHSSPQRLVDAARSTCALFQRSPLRPSPFRRQRARVYPASRPAMTWSSRKCGSASGKSPHRSVLCRLEGGEILEHVPGFCLLEGVGVEPPEADRG